MLCQIQPPFLFYRQVIVQYLGDKAALTQADTAPSRSVTQKGGQISSYEDVKGCSAERRRKHVHTW